MYPSEVLKRIKADQEEIERALTKIEALLSTSGAEAVQALRTACVGLVPKLVEHILLDDTLLAPALAETDAWRELRAQRLEEHHEHQRADINLIVQRISRTDTSEHEVRAIARGIVAQLRKDFAEQADLMVNKEVLRDDVINAAPGC